MTRDVFFDHVMRMRHAQKQYFKTKRPDWLRRARFLECKVDSMIENEINPSLFNQDGGQV